MDVTATSFMMGLGFFCALSAQCSQPEIPEDARWDYRFALPGVQGYPLAMAFDKKLIYVGGSLESVGRTVADGVAVIDGKKVTVLPDGPEQSPFQLNVTDMEMFQGKLCVAGYFTNVANQPAGGFGVWNGSGWDPVQITNGFVYSLEPAGNKGIFVAGRFFLPGRTNPVVLARWDGKNGWEDFNLGLPPCGDVRCVRGAYQPQASDDGSVIVTLELNVTTTFPTYVLARYDSEKNWQTMPGPNDDARGLGYYALGKYQGNVVAGGSFSNSANASLRNIAIWDGSLWQPMGGGLEHQVFAVAGDRRLLFAATYFTDASGFSQVRIMRWDGTAWSRVGGDDFDADSSGRLHLGPNGDLYYSGFFTGVGNVVAPNLIRWNGKKWEPVLKGDYQGISDIVPRVLSIIEHNGKVCIGGRVTTAGSIFSRGVAAWDGHRWQDIGSGIHGSRTHAVRALASAEWGLVAGGVFTNIDGLTCSNIASWDGTNWNALGDGVNGTVAALTMHNGSLVAGGRFTHAGDIAANNVASWDGVEWHPFGAGCNSNVSALVSWHSNLYAGGVFTNAGGVSAQRIARWDGSGWQSIGGISGGSQPSVNAFAATPDALYIGGRFTTAGGQPILSLARWDGTNWNSVGGGWPGTILALAVRGNTLYAGGTWTNSSSKIIHAVRRWDGTNWSDLGSGVANARSQQLVSALLPTQDALWVGGRFSWAGQKPSANIARWIEAPQLGMTRRFDKNDKNHKAGRLEFRVDLGMRGHLETSTDLLNWTTVPDAHDDSSDWQIDAPDSPGKWFYRFALER